MSAETYKITHCLFDMDGLLLDTEYLYTKAFNRITNRYGKEYTWEHKAYLMGLKSKDAASYIVEELELPLTAEEFKQEVFGIYRELFPQTNPMPGAVRLLKHLKENNVPIALATSSDRESYELKTGRWRDLFELFDHKVIGGSDPEVIHGKPEPDIFLTAARRFHDNPDPSKCLVFEDAPNGVKAALNAGMQVVMVPDPMLPKHYTSEATLILNSLEDFQPTMFGLPPYVTSPNSSKSSCDPAPPNIAALELAPLNISVIFTHENLLRFNCLSIASFSVLYAAIMSREHWDNKSKSRMRSSYFSDPISSNILI